MSQKHKQDTMLWINCNITRKTLRCRWRLLCSIHLESCSRQQVLHRWKKQHGNSLEEQLYFPVTKQNEIWVFTLCNKPSFLFFSSLSRYTAQLQKRNENFCLLLKTMYFHSRSHQKSRRTAETNHAINLSLTTPCTALPIQHLFLSIASILTFCLSL